MADLSSPAGLIPRFKLGRVLNQDQAGRRVSLHGSIDDQPAVLLVERAPFPADEAYLGRLPACLARVRTLGANDVYSWSMARVGEHDHENDRRDGAGEDGGKGSDGKGNDDFVADVKINLIYPCTEAHVAKYSRQAVRAVTETPDIYRQAVRPYMQAKREQGRLNWVFNIIEGKKEVEDVIYRTPLGEAGDEGFLLLPDLNWDRRTLDALHLLAIVERRDMWSLRDLRKRHVPWLERMRASLVAATVATYPSLEPDQLKLYLHYQPTYYHLHVHIVHVALEAGATQAVGKALALDAVVETLRAMAGGDDAGMDGISMTYTLGEASELWRDVFAPLKTSGPALR